MNISTERLKLREFEADDWSAVLAYQRKPELSIFCSGGFHQPHQKTKITRRLEAHWC